MGDPKILIWFKVEHRRDDGAWLHTLDKGGVQSHFGTFGEAQQYIGFQESLVPGWAAEAGFRILKVTEEVVG